jgi:ATP-dependent Clp protease adaptor protein ClpS
MQTIMIFAGTKTAERTRPKATERQEEDQGGSGWIVIVYDNDKNTYEQVIEILMRATGCTKEQAYHEAWEVDHLGKSVVHHGSKEECERVAGIIRTIGIRVEVVEE